MRLCQIFSAGLMAAILQAIPSLADTPSRYVRQTAGLDTVIVFVHGVLGDGQSTWSTGNKYWPDMLASDQAFSGANIFVYSYPTALWGTMSPNELAENMRLQLEAKGVSDHRRIVFLAHSMGGLITRAYLLKNRDVAARTSFAYFFSTPTAGSQLASLATLISSNPQLQKMKPMNPEDYLADLLRDWLAADFKIPTYCAYERRPTYTQTIVTFQSASSLCTKRVDPIDTNHIDIVKPANEDAVSYLAFKAAYTHEMAVRRPNAALIEHFERILNSLQQTQIRKMEELFPQIDNYRKNPTEANWTMVKDTARALVEEIQGAVRAAIAFDSQFYEYGQEIIQIANGTKATVDRSFYQPFRVSRQEWNGRQFVLKEI